MDKNQVTGLILISLLLLGYFYFAQDMQPPPEQQTQTETLPTTPSQDETELKAAENVTADSVTLAQQRQEFGELAPSDDRRS